MSLTLSADYGINTLLGILILLVLEIILVVGLVASVGYTSAWIAKRIVRNTKTRVGVRKHLSNPFVISVLLLAVQVALILAIFGQGNDSRLGNFEILFMFIGGNALFTTVAYKIINWLP